MEYSTSDDRALVRAFREGDEKAFAEIVHRYQRQVANVLFLTLGRREEVEDLSQEVFLRVHRSLHRVTIEASLFSWIYRIALNLAIDEVRRRKLRKLLSLDSPAGSLEQDPAMKDVSSAADGVLNNEKKEEIRKALQKLSSAYRTALVLREYEDMSYKEIAGVLHISEQAVKSRIFRAREELKGYLTDYFKERT